MPPPTTASIDTIVDAAYGTGTDDEMNALEILGAFHGMLSGGAAVSLLATIDDIADHYGLSLFQVPTYARHVICMIDSSGFQSYLIPGVDRVVHHQSEDRAIRRAALVDLMDRS